MRTTITALVTAMACLASGCSSSEDTMIVVSVDAPNAIASAYYLRVTIKNNGDPEYKQFPASVASSPLVFPTSFGLHLPRDRKGTLTFDIDALDESTMTTLASGKGTLELKVGERLDLCVGLVPKCAGSSPGGDTPSKDGGANNPSPDGRGATLRGGLPAGARFARVSAGTEHSCAVSTDGSLWCWGANNLGQLGLGDTQDAALPVRVAGSSWIDVTSGSAATCALQSTGVLACWGNNGSGQVGNGTKKAGSFVAIPFPLDGSWSKVSVGWYHVLALQPDGTLLSWGDNTSDQLGDRKVPSEGRDAPGPVNTSQWLTADGTTFAAGYLHSCALGGDSSLWCWGNNALGQLGDGTTRSIVLDPTALPGNDWAQVSAGFYHTCAIKTDASLWCWGDNSEGQLGIGSTTASRKPERVTSPGSWIAVSTGHSHTCGLQGDGSLWCWGGNSDGQLGTGQAATMPTLLQGSAASWKVVSAGDGHTCAVAGDGTLWCWGRNKAGQLGIGSTINQSTPKVLGS